MESPTSWVMETHDVAALAALAKSHGVLTMIDNSWASPIFQQPIALGVDLVIHSASKYLGGHSDVVAGVVAGSKALIGRIRGEAYPYLGGKLSPFDAWLLIRGLRTLPIRMKAHERSAMAIVKKLQSHAAVEAVCYPGLANQLAPGLTGTSGLFSFIFREGINIRRFADQLVVAEILDQARPAGRADVVPAVRLQELELLFPRQLVPALAPVDRYAVVTALLAHAYVHVVHRFERCSPVAGREGRAGGQGGA